jgi:hypothetical protein
MSSKCLLTFLPLSPYPTTLAVGRLSLHPSSTFLQQHQQRRHC